MNFDITQPNVGHADRLVRGIVGVLLIVGAVRGGSWVAGLIGAVLIATAYFRFCPSYAAFGINTNKYDPNPEAKDMTHQAK